MVRRAVLTTILAMAVASCTSTQERFDTASSLMAQERYTDAAGEYIRILESDPEFPGARDGLLEAGTLAVEGLLSDRSSAADAGAYEDASHLLVRLDRFRSRSSLVGVELPVPADYEDLRRQTHDQAIEYQISLGDAAAEIGDWSEAISQYRGARETPGGEEHRDLLDDRAGRTHLLWGEQDLDEGRFQDAVDRFTQALDLLQDESDQDRALYNRDQAFVFGTRWTAFLPVVVSGPGESAPSGFSQALEGFLHFEYWDHPPPFVSQIDPADLRRVLRRENLNGRPPSTREAAMVGRLVDSHLVAITELVQYEAVETEVRRTQRQATMTVGRRGGTRDTTFVSAQATLTIEATLQFTLVDTERGDIVEDTEVSARYSDRIHWGEFPGDPQTLNLSTRDRDLFDAQALESERREVEDGLLDRLVERYADRVFDRIIRQVP